MGRENRVINICLTVFREELRAAMETECQKIWMHW